MPLLDIRNLGVAYDGFQVFSAFNLQLYEGQLYAVLGEEGAGKSTLQKAITQQLRYSGEIFFKGQSLQGTSTHLLNKLGIGYVLQGGNILKNFTVEETINLVVRKMNRTEVAEKWEIIRHFFPKILTLRHQQAGRLSGGERMMLSLAGIAAMDAKLVVLDEPTAGLAPEVCEVIQLFIGYLQQKNIAVLVMEHNFEWSKSITKKVLFIS